MRAERFFGCLAAATMVLAIASCAPIVRRDGSAEGTGGAGGEDPMGGAPATGGETGTGGSVATGGATDTGGVTETGGAAGSGGSDSGGSTSSGGTTGTGGVTGTGGSSAGGITGLGGLGGTTSTVCGVAKSYGWSSTPALMDPVSDGSHSLVGIKAPSVVFYGNKYHVFATVLSTTGSPTIEHIQFSDWAGAGSATVDYLDNNAAFGKGRSQPQIFYFEAKKTWYLISQGPAPAYSTNSDVGLASGWSKPTNFYASTPSIVTQNAGAGGIGWTDFWVICDSANCFLFFTNQIGYLFRARTSAASFPNGFGDPVIVMQKAGLSQGSRIYKVSNSTVGYLMLIECTGSGGVFIGGWSATALDGTWTALAETEGNPYAGASNTAFGNNKWTWDVGHGELVRTGYDETMTVDNCNMRYFFAGKDHYAAAKTEPYPWKLGLLVRTK